MNVIGRGALARLEMANPSQRKVRTITYPNTRPLQTNHNLTLTLPKPYLLYLDLNIP